MKLILQSILQTIVWTILLGLLYPLVMTVIAQLAFPYQANGSLIKDDKGNIIGSELLAQQFTGTKYFWPRPSADGYGTTPAAGSNLGPTSSTLQTNVRTPRPCAMRTPSWMRPRPGAVRTSSSLLPVALTLISLLRRRDSKSAGSPTPGD